MYRAQLGLDDDKLLNHLIKTYSWDAVHQICDNKSHMIKCMFGNSNTPLHEISSIGSAPFNLLKKVVDCWVDATMIKNRHGETPLHIKCRGSQYSSYPIIMLIESNSKALRVTNNTGKTPLAIACASGACISVIRELVLAYPQALPIRDIHGHTPLDLLWSAFAKTLPGASAISGYLGNVTRDEGEEQAEMSGLLSRFHQKISLCLARSYSINRNRDLTEEDFSLICHALLSENLKHSPHTLLAILLTHDNNLGSQVDEDGRTILHIKIKEGCDEDCISLIVDKCKLSASIANNQGILPLHLILEEMITDSDSTCDDSVRKVVNAFPEALDIKSPDTNFYPFMSAGVANNHQLSYEFLLQSPSIVSNFIN